MCAHILYSGLDLANFGGIGAVLWAETGVVVVVAAAAVAIFAAFLALMRGRVGIM